ncbi:hypothetical protein LDENG_00227600 [Lucifuga dentata]|nr:hypothetical protein LDENG_00227600 [Lucifuga dentata]
MIPGSPTFLTRHQPAAQANTSLSLSLSVSLSLSLCFSPSPTAAATHPETTEKPQHPDHPHPHPEFCSQRRQEKPDNCSYHKRDLGLCPSFIHRRRIFN